MATKPATNPTTKPAALADIADVSWPRPVSHESKLTGIVQRYLDQHASHTPGTVRAAHDGPGGLRSNRTTDVVVHCTCPICTDALAALGIERQTGYGG